MTGCGNPAPTPSIDTGPRTAGPAAPAARPVAGPERLVVAFGDSLYAGYGLPRGASMPDGVQARLRADGINARVVNAGVSGETTAAGRARLPFVLDSQPRTPDLVLLGLGGNDLLRGIAPAETRANLEAMLAELDRRHIPVVLTGMRAPPNLGRAHQTAFDAIWPELARRHGAVLDPFILQDVITDPKLMLADRVHPNPAGAARIADRVAPLVAQVLGRKADAHASHVGTGPESS